MLVFGGMCTSIWEKWEVSILKMNRVKFGYLDDGNDREIEDI